MLHAGSTACAADDNTCKIIGILGPRSDTGMEQMAPRPSSCTRAKSLARIAGKQLWTAHQARPEKEIRSKSARLPKESLALHGIRTPGLLD